MIIFSHRGKTSTDDPENTVESFLKLNNNDIKNVEFDIRKTHDDILVVIHDKNTKRISNVNLSISKSNLNELSEIKILNSYKIPTLKDCLDVLNKLEVINIEIKEKNIADQLNIFLDDFLSSRPDYKPKFLISSRLKKEISKIKTSERIETGLIMNFFALTRLRFYKIKPSVLIMNRFFLRPSILKYCNKNSILIFCYTVNTATEFQRISGLKIDGLYTDNYKFLSNL